MHITRFFFFFFALYQNCHSEIWVADIEGFNTVLWTLILPGCEYYFLTETNVLYAWNTQQDHRVVHDCYLSVFHPMGSLPFCIETNECKNMGNVCAQEQALQCFNL